MVRGSRLGLLLFVFIYSGELFAVEGVDCGVEYEEWAECIFMKESNQLTMDEQSLLRKTKYDLTRTIEDSKQLAIQWQNGLKSTGPTPDQIAMIPDVVSDLTRVSGSAASIVAKTVMSDPWKMHKWKKADFRWKCIVAYKEPCILVKDLVDISNMAVNGIKEAKNKLNSVLDNPNLVLGEEWGNFEKDINEIRSRYKSVESMAHNLSPKNLENRYKKHFKFYGEQLKMTVYSRAEWENETGKASHVMNDSIRDTLMATKKQYQRMANTQNAGDLSDLESIKSLNEKLPMQVGRMQAYEQLNMRKIQSVDAWRMIQESYLSQNDLFALDMAEEEREEGAHEAALTKFYENKNITVINDGKGYR